MANTTLTGQTVTLDLAGPDGNAWVILGTVARLLKQWDRETGANLAEQYRTEAMSGDYDHLLDVTRRYVDLQDAGRE